MNFRHENNHNTFGGVIYPSDFNCSYPGTTNANQCYGSDIAARIVADWNKYGRPMKGANND